MKKLKINKETIVKLNQEQMNTVRGGEELTMTVGRQCVFPSNNPPCVSPTDIVDTILAGC